MENKITTMIAGGDLRETGVLDVDSETLARFLSTCPEDGRIVQSALFYPHEERVECTCMLHPSKELPCLGPWILETSNQVTYLLVGLLAEMPRDEGEKTDGKISHYLRPEDFLEYQRTSRLAMSDVNELHLRRRIPYNEEFTVSARIKGPIDTTRFRGGGYITIQVEAFSTDAREKEYFQGELLFFSPIPRTSPSSG